MNHILYTVLYTVQCTVYSVHYTLLIVHCTLYNAQCAMYIVHCSANDFHNILNLHISIWTYLVFIDRNLANTATSDINMEILLIVFGNWYIILYMICGEYIKHYTGSTVWSVQYILDKYIVYTPIERIIYIYIWYVCKYMWVWVCVSVCGCVCLLYMSVSMCVCFILPL